MWINWGNFLKVFSPLAVFLCHPKSAPSINWKWMLIEKTNRCEKRIDYNHKLYHSPEIHIYNNGLGLLLQNLIHYGDLDIVLEARAWKRPCSWYYFLCLLETWYLRLMKHIFMDPTVLLHCYYDLCICSPNRWVLFSGVGISCWMSPSASWAPGVFGAQALSWSVSCHCVVDIMLRGYVCCTRLRGPYRQVIKGSSFFLMSFKNRYSIRNNVWKFQVSTMKIVPVACIWSLGVTRIITSQRHEKGA